MYKNHERKTIHFSIKDDFTEYPGLRYKKHSDDSGEALRDDFLIPLLEQNPGYLLVVDLEGTAGMCSSFLEEAFGGLVRKLGRGSDKGVIPISNNINAVYEVTRYMEDVHG